MNDRHELDQFKRFIDLREYAASLGYQVDKRETGRNPTGRGATVMRCGADKISVRYLENGHWCYYGWREEQDKGTILEFVQHRKNLNLGEVRKELRPWVGRASPTPPRANDRKQVQDQFAKMQIVKRHSYLENERGIPTELLASDRFAGCVRVNWFGDAVFGHTDGDGVLSGFEIRGKNFKGFVAGGRKGLWLSQVCPDDDRLVICEAAIDCLSYAALFPHERARYASIAGTMSDLQRTLVRVAIGRMPPNAEIVCAMDADESGREHARALRNAFDLVEGCNLCFRDHVPEGHNDWNDALQAALGTGPGYE
jgi:hypothetical protein